MPDIFVPIDTTGYSDYYRDLTAKGVINRFAISYVDDNRKALKKQFPDEQSFLDGFTVTPEMIQEMVNLGEKDSVKANPEQLEVSLPTIKAIVKGLIGRDMFETSTYYKVVNPVLNPVYSRGLAIINDPDQYRALLSAHKQQSKK